MEIDEFAFSCCKSLSTVTLNDQLESVGDSAFTSAALESIAIPGTVKRLGEEAFCGIPLLRQVHLSEGLEEICAGCF